MNALSFWFEPDPDKIWNVAHFIDSDNKMKLLQWISSGSEIYNKFNGMCPTSHPNLMRVAHALCQENDSVVQHMDDVAMFKAFPPDYDEPVFPQIPPEVYANNMKATARKGAKGATTREAVII